jgi:hypothetical protein
MQFDLTRRPDADRRPKLDPEPEAERLAREKYKMSRSTWHALAKPEVSLGDYKAAKKKDEERRQRGSSKKR